MKTGTLMRNSKLPVGKYVIAMCTTSSHPNGVPSPAFTYIVTTWASHRRPRGTRPRGSRRRGGNCQSPSKGLLRLTRPTLGARRETSTLARSSGLAGRVWPSSRWWVGEVLTCGREETCSEEGEGCISGSDIRLWREAVPPPTLQTMLFSATLSARPLSLDNSALQYYCCNSDSPTCRSRRVALEGSAPGHPPSRSGRRSDHLRHKPVAARPIHWIGRSSTTTSISRMSTDLLRRKLRDKQATPKRL